MLIFARLSVLLSVVLLGLPATAATTQKTARATLNIGAKPNLAGASGTRIRQFSTIRANVLLIDDGTNLTVNGQGAGFDASLSYTSFFYGTGSVQYGSLACIPPNPNNLTATQMITAYWLPVGSTRRTLTVVKTGTSYVPLSAIGTMSVRYDSTPTLPLATNLNPGRYWLNSCGSIYSLSDANAKK